MVPFNSDCELRLCRARFSQESLGMFSEVRGIPPRMRMRRKKQRRKRGIRSGVRRGGGEIFWLTFYVEAQRGITFGSISSGWTLKSQTSTKHSQRFCCACKHVPRSGGHQSPGSVLSTPDSQRKLFYVLENPWEAGESHWAICFIVATSTINITRKHLLYVVCPGTYCTPLL